MRHAIEFQTRQRMRPWLQSRIDSGEIPGLSWIDKPLGIFQVPWKHGGKHDWKASEAQIFKEWAMHTGRYREGIDEPDYPTWKTRFRCALNKLPDIQEIKERSHLDDPCPFRVYQLQKRKVNCQNSKEMQREDRNVPLNFSSHIPTTVEATYKNDTGNKPINLTSDLAEIDPADLVHLSLVPALPYNNCVKQEAEMDTSDASATQRVPDSSLEVDPLAFFTDSSTGAPVMNQTSELYQAPFKEQEPAVHEMYVQIHYRDLEVISSPIRSTAGCRLYSGPDVKHVMLNDLKKQVYGSSIAEELALPVSDSLLGSPKQRHLTLQLINVMDRGILFENENGNIYATRKCRCVVFVAPPHCGQVKRLNREEKVMIFDYNYFRTMLQQYMMGKVPKPASFVILGFGQTFQHDIQMPYTSLLISATVFHAKASFELRKISCLDPFSLQIQISKSDDYDKFLDDVKQVERENAQMMIN